MPQFIRVIVKRMLKSGIISDEGYEENAEDTPQGSILSPTGGHGNGGRSIYVAIPNVSSTYLLF